MNKFMSSIGLVCLLFGVANAQIISKDGVATDTVTGLMWQDDGSMNDTLSFQNALQYCSDSTLNGYSDWRLPNIFELMTLIDKSSKGDTSIYFGFKNMISAPFFSSTKDDNWIWILSSGSGNIYKNYKDYASNLLCVRGNEVGIKELIKLANQKKIKITMNEIKETSSELTNKIEKQLWNDVSSQNTSSAYKEYLKEFPNGEYTSSARSNIQYLESEAQFRALLQSKSPQTMYIEAGKQERNGNTSKANKLYEAIIDRFPNSDFAVKASDKLTSAERAERTESNRRSQSRQECENNKNACLASCGTYISGADSHNNAVWSCNDKCKQISCY